MLAQNGRQARQQFSNPSADDRGIYCRAATNYTPPPRVDHLENRLKRLVPMDTALESSLQFRCAASPAAAASGPSTALTAALRRGLVALAIVLFAATRWYIFFELDPQFTDLQGKYFDCAARVVELRYFAGLSLDQVAKTLHLARRTVDRDWSFARAFLKVEFGASH